MRLVGLLELIEVRSVELRAAVSCHRCCGPAPLRALSYSDSWDADVWNACKAVACHGLDNG